MLPDLPAEQISTAINHVAEIALWEAGVGNPPVDAFRVAEQRGATIAEDTLGGPRARRVELGDHEARGTQPRRDTSVILLAPEPRRERRHWAVAHEVGESLACEVFSALGIDASAAPPTTREWVANRLACSLLLPRGWFVDAMMEVDADLYALKERFATASHELIARRWLEAIGGPIVVTVMDQGVVTWRRTNFATGRLPMTPEEKDVWRFAHEQNKPTSCAPVLYGDSGVFSRVRCWPVHEPGWRREVLLWEVAEAW